MEPTNHPFRKENDLPNLHNYVPFFRVTHRGCVKPPEGGSPIFSHGKEQGRSLVHGHGRP